MPTISDGFEGFSDLILSVVLTRLPPMMRSYSRPSCARTLEIAARIRRAFSSLRKSKNGSVTNGPVCRVVRGRTGASNVAMGESFQCLNEKLRYKTWISLHPVRMLEWAASQFDLGSNVRRLDTERHAF